MSATGDVGGEAGRSPSEEELRAAYEAQLKQLRVEHILIDNVVSLINLGMRRTGLAPGTEAERDPGQVRLAIEAVRALMPQLEQVAPGEIGQIRDAVSQLQLAYVRIGGQAAAETGAAPPGAVTGAPPPAPGPEGGAAPPPPASGAPTPPASGAPTPPASGAPPSAKPGEPGPAQRSGRLWVPGS